METGTLSILGLGCMPMALSNNCLRCPRPGSNRNINRPYNIRTRLLPIDLWLDSIRHSMNRVLPTKMLLQWPNHNLAFKVRLQILWHGNLRFGQLLIPDCLHLAHLLVASLASSLEPRQKMTPLSTQGILWLER